MIDLLLRGGAIAVLALLAALLWRAPSRQQLFALSRVCGGLFLLVKGVEIASALGPLRLPVPALAATGPFWFLFATRRAFGAEPAASRASLAAAGLGLGGLAMATGLAPAPLQAGLSIA